MCIYVNYHESKNLKEDYNISILVAQKYNMKYAVRTSMSDYREQDWMVNFPLYDIGNLNQYYCCQDEKTAHRTDAK